MNFEAIVQGDSVTIATVLIGRLDGQSARRSEDLVAVEEALEIRVGGESLTVTMRTPGNDFELAAGFLFSEGMVEHYGQIHSIGRPADGNASIVEVELSGGMAARPVAPQRNFVMTSACGLCGKSSLEALETNRCPELPADEVRIDPAALYALPERLRTRQAAFDATGGIHAAALFSLSGGLVMLREDVGRHNAVDKLIGAALIEGRMPLSDTVMLVSGRASYELVQKALMGGIPVLAAVGAPSSLAIATAGRCGMTLIGFLRDGRFNVYTGIRRVIGLEASA